MKKRKFALLGVGEGSVTTLNELGGEGWDFDAMEPFYQEKPMYHTHIIRKVLASFAKKNGTVFRYRAKLLRGNSVTSASFRVDDFNEETERLRRCGFELAGFQHIIELHMRPENSTRRAMRGYFCVWRMELDRENAEKLNERAECVARVLQDEPCFQKRLSISGGDSENLTGKRLDWLCEIAEKVDVLDAKELKRQMGAEWDDGLNEVKPDFRAVAEAVAFLDDPLELVREILWCSMGNLIVSAFPK